MTKLSKFLVALACFLLAAASNASSLTVIDPGNGGAYTLDVTLKAGTTSTYTVILTANLNSPNVLLNGGQYIEQAEFKIANGYSNVSFLSGPSGATWTAMGGPLNANGCGGNNTGFVCIDGSGGASATGGLTIGSTKVFVWTAEVTLAPGVQLDSQWHIGLHYTEDASQCSTGRPPKVCTTVLGGKNSGIVSLSGTPTITPPIPEPASMAVFGLGALMVGAALRKRASA